MSKEGFKAVDIFHSGMVFKIYQGDAQEELRSQMTRTLKRQLYHGCISDCLGNRHNKWKHWQFSEQGSRTAYKDALKSWFQLE